MGEDYRKTPVEAYKASCYGHTDIKDFQQTDDRDEMVTEKARSIVKKHNFTLDASGIEVRVVKRIPPQSFFHGEAIGRCASYGPPDQWQGSVIMVAEQAYNDENILEGVLRHELAHAIHHSYDRTHSEDDINFQRLCEYLGGFVSWDDYAAAMRQK